MFSVAPNIVFAPNMTQNAERKHRTQDTNTANFRSSLYHTFITAQRIKLIVTEQVIGPTAVCNTSGSLARYASSLADNF